MLQVCQLGSQLAAASRGALPTAAPGNNGPLPSMGGFLAQHPRAQASVSEQHGAGAATVRGKAQPGHQAGVTELPPAQGHSGVVHNFTRMVDMSCPAGICGCWSWPGLSWCTFPPSPMQPCQRTWRACTLGAATRSAMQPLSQVMSNAPRPSHACTCTSQLCRALAARPLW